MDRKNVESIFPLLDVQKALLMHSLSAKKDEGILILTFDLIGEFDKALFNEALAYVTKRQTALRTSIHWEKIKNPVQIVHRHVDPQISFVQSSEDNNKVPAKYSLSLIEAPLSKWEIERQSDEIHRVCWTCHHIILDGWSSMIILQEVLQYYNCVKTNKPLSFKAPAQFQDYINWLKSKDKAAAFTFWENLFKGYSHDIGFIPPISDKNQKVFIELTDEQSENIRQTVREIGCSANAYFQWAWGFVLCKLFGTQEIPLAITSSGRSAPIENLEILAGIFTKVLPLRFSIDKKTTISASILHYQRLLAEILNFEWANYSAIYEHLVDQLGFLEFPALFTFENFPVDEWPKGPLDIQHFKGDITSVYPMSLIIIPNERIGINLLYRFEASESETKMSETIAVFISVLEAMTDASHVIHDLWNSISMEPIRFRSISNAAPLVSEIKPASALEIKLIRIWKKVLGISSFGLTDSFFALGGKSIQAIRLISEIQTQLDQSINPSLLIKYPSIRQLANYLSGNGVDSDALQSIIPLQMSDHRSNVFCLHAGEGNVFFYQEFARYLSEKASVYAIHPFEPDGSPKLFDSIRAMAEQYGKEIISVQPEGPYFLIGYCFSNPVCVEIADFIRSINGANTSIFIIDSGTEHVEDIADVQGKMRKAIEILKNQNWDRLAYIINEKREKFFEKYLPRWQRAEVALKRTIKAELSTIFGKYVWGKSDANIVLIRSSQFVKRADKKHEAQWSNIASNPIEIRIIEAQHEQIFETPAVQELARTIGEYTEPSRHQE